MSENMDCNRKIVLPDGEEYYGYAFGDSRDRVCEIVFNTSMAGYQEILSDPSYTGQAVVMTYPLIGNYGMADEDYETEIPTIGGLIVRDYNDKPSNFRSRASLAQVMKKYGIAGVWGVDTRKLTRSIRDFGSRKCLICPSDMPKEDALTFLAGTELPKNVVEIVSCRKKMIDGRNLAPEAWISPAPEERYRVAAIDCGIKYNIIRSLNKKGVTMKMFPWNVTPEEILAWEPDGLFLSNGPGDPEDVPETVETVRKLVGRIPIFGICLGHQILSLALGARIYKLKFGHRGGNHPVKNLLTGKIEITSQNHSYAVDADSLKGTILEPTHINLLDQTIEGVRCESLSAFGVQYHPESAPGPQDSAGLFDEFIRLMEGKKDA